MNCIDAIEGTVKSILMRMCDGCVTHGKDQSDYIRDVQTVLDGTDDFFVDNPEVIENPDLAGQVLYNFARQLWVEQATQDVSLEDVAEQSQEDIEYLEYTFDHLYTHGNYPL